MDGCTHRLPARLRFDPVKPFLFLGTRAEDDAADGEYHTVLRFSGLAEHELDRVRLEQRALAEVNLAAYSGIVLGGGPFNISDPGSSKSPVQVRVEADLRALVERVVAVDFPFLGACYGIGTLGSLRGGVVDRTYGEAVGAAPITLTDAGRADPLFGVLPAQFDAFLGHKEAVRDLPTGALLLATGDACPVQGFRLGRNVYATQFHPELDAEQLILRIGLYREHGYFHPDEHDDLVARAHAAAVTAPPLLLTRFAELYARS